jgi:putative ATPase
MRKGDKKELLVSLRGLLQADGAISLAETVPKETQRLYALVDSNSLSREMIETWREAEEQIYADQQDPMVNWAGQDLRKAFAEAGFREIEVQQERLETERLITDEHIARWFDATSEGRPSYAQHLSQQLTQDTIAQIRRIFEEQVAGRTRPWHSTIAFVRAQRAAKSVGPKA